jgi:polyhydroxyalkanoate synthase
MYLLNEDILFHIGNICRPALSVRYQENLLIRNRMVVGGKSVNLKHIRMPLLNVIAKHDHLVTPAACQTLIDRVGGRDTENFCLDTGHLGIFVSARFGTSFCKRPLVG